MRRTPITDNEQTPNMWAKWQIEEYRQVETKHGEPYAVRWFYAKFSVFPQCDNCSAPAQKLTHVDGGLNLCPDCAALLGTVCKHGLTFERFINSNAGCGRCNDLNHGWHKA